jgi:serine/threonine-protein kinase RsbW
VDSRPAGGSGDWRSQACRLSALDISLQNDPAELSRLSGLLEEYAREQKLSERTRRAVMLSLHEHVSNIVAYGFDDANRHQIMVRIRSEGQWIHIEVEDDGRPFDPRAHPAPSTDVPLDHKPLGGLGIHMMRRLMDELNYRRAGGRNILTLKKKAR